MIREIIDERGQGDPEGAGESRRLAVGLGLIETEHEGPVVGGQLAKVEKAFQADPIDPLGIHFRIHGLGRAHADGGKLFGAQAFARDPVETRLTDGAIVVTVSIGKEDREPLLRMESRSPGSHDLLERQPII